MNTNFDWVTYIENYEDLRNAGINTYESALQHWNMHGKKEGRTYIDLKFDWVTYIENYEDLRNAGINTYESALQHWNMHGKKEGRTFKNINLNINNLFDYMNDSIIYDNIYYYIDDIFGNTLILLGVKDNKIITYSNEWLYLIKTYYINKKCYDIYNKIIYTFFNMNKLLSKKNNIISNKIIILISSFSTGTAHGYTFILYALNEYLEKYKNDDVLVYENSQKGILDLIKYIIPNNKIKIINKKKLYKIQNPIFIPNKHHGWNKTNYPIANNIIKKHFIIENYDKYKEYLYKNICIIKNNNTENITSCNTTYEDACIFSKNHNAILLDPSKFNEIDLINILYRCTRFYVTFGTAYAKNFIYLSNICERIICLMTPDYIHQFNEINFIDNTDVYKVTEKLIFIEKIY
jgi:hypothetical protein